MAQRSIARRYAKAALQVADGAGRVDETLEELGFAVQAITGLSDIEEILTGGVLAPARLKAVVDEVFSQAGASAIVRGLLGVMCENDRLWLLPEVHAEYSRMLDERASRIEAVVFTAHPLDEKERSLVSKALGTHTGKEVRLKVEHDPSLLSGVRVRMGNTVFDNSARGRLDSLLKQFE